MNEQEWNLYKHKQEWDFHRQMARIRVLLLANECSDPEWDNTRARALLCLLAYLDVI